MGVTWEPGVLQGGHQHEVDVRTRPGALACCGPRPLREEAVLFVPFHFGLYEAQHRVDFLPGAAFPGLYRGDLVLERVADAAMGVERTFLQHIVHVLPCGGVTAYGDAREGDLRQLEFEHRPKIVQAPDVRLAFERRDVRGIGLDFADVE